MMRTILLTSLVALVSSQVTCGWCNAGTVMKDPRWVDGFYKGQFVTAVDCVDCADEKNHKACMDSGCFPGPGHKCTPDNESCGVDVSGKQGTCCPGSACYRFEPAGEGEGYICKPAGKPEVDGSMSSAQAGGISLDAQGQPLGIVPDASKQLGAPFNVSALTTQAGGALPAALLV